MAKRKRKAPKTDRFTVLTGTEATLMRMPRYNGYACGNGAHGKRGYDRNAEKRRFREEVGA